MPTDDPDTLLRILFPASGRPGRGGPRPGSGRPRKAASLAEHRLTAHATEAQKAEIEHAASRAGESVSEFMLAAALQRARE